MAPASSRRTPFTTASTSIPGRWSSITPGPRSPGGRGRPPPPPPRCYRTRQPRREDLGPFPSDLGGDALEVRVEGLRELLAGCLGPRRPEIPKRLDPATAALLVMPEIQVRPSADRLRRHATTDLHGSDIRLTLLKVNAPSRGGMAGVAPPLDFHWKRSWRAGPLRSALDVPPLSPPAGGGGNSAPFASPGPPVGHTLAHAPGPA